MAAQTRSGGGLKAMLVVVVGIAALAWWFGDMEEDDGVGIYPPGGRDDESRSVVLIVNWSHPVEREITTTYWINGERHAGLQEESMKGEWREWFTAPMGTLVRVLAENVGAGGRLSCFIFEGPPGNEILVREMNRLTGDAGECELEHRVGDPPNVEPID